jgi:hypothetical protein
MFLPKEQLSTTGLLANADFKFPLSGEAFNWALSGGEGFRIQIDSEPDNSNKPALHFPFIGGRVGDHSADAKPGQIFHGGQSAAGARYSFTYVAWARPAECCAPRATPQRNQPRSQQEQRRQSPRTDTGVLRK